MSRTLHASIALAALTLPFAANALSAAEVQITASNPVVELNVFEQVEVAPDIVTIGAGVSTEAPTAVEALRRNSAEMRRVVDLIKARGVNPRDIQTTAINLSAQYDYDRTNQRQVFRAYQASNRVSVKLRDIPRAGEMLDALVAAGATNIFGPIFSIEDDTSAKAEARKRALERGQKQAMEYAVFAGYSGVRLLQVSESMSRNSGPVAMERSMMQADVSAAPPPPMEPGLISTGVSISLTYEMMR
ncbi:SIMPL domain-containing protein [Altererythrobacter sp.]|nr:SIMPL domain-containing protein [Altererythrobacter sp.]